MNSMTDPCFVDSNVLVYARDRAEPGKQSRAHLWLEHLWQSHLGRVSTQVLVEFYVTATQKIKPGMEREMARRDVRRFLTWQPAVIDRAMIERAWSIQDRHVLSWWDSLVVAAAQILRCRYLLTEDLSAGQRFDELEVVNPFEKLPEDF